MPTRTDLAALGPGTIWFGGPSYSVLIKVAVRSSIDHGATLILPVTRHRTVSGHRAASALRSQGHRSGEMGRTD